MDEVKEDIMLDGMRGEDAEDMLRCRQIVATKLCYKLQIYK